MPEVVRASGAILIFFCLVEIFVLADLSQWHSVHRSLFTAFDPAKNCQERVASTFEVGKWFNMFGSQVASGRLFGTRLAKYASFKGI
jgi:hypothetical protein